MVRKLNDSMLTELRAISFLVVATLVALLSPVTAATQYSPREAALWNKVYEAVNPGMPVVWPRGGPRAWARAHPELVDAIISTIIQGDSELPWFHGLIAARIVAGPETRDALFGRLTQRFNDAVASVRGTSENDCAELAGIASILSVEGDQRSVPIINALLRDGECDDNAKEKLLVAVQRIGNEGTQVVLAQLRQQSNREVVERAAAFAEKIIGARVRGRDILENADDELRSVTDRFSKACEAVDLQAFVACFPWHSHQGFDEDDMHEFLDSQDAEPAIESVRAALAANTSFEIDRETLQAKLVCDDRYFVEYIYEVDGWKIRNIRPFPRPRAQVPPPTPPIGGKGSKRIIIGKPARESEKP